MTRPWQKRGDDGRYEHTGDWNRLCVCGHTLGVHAAGSPADCLLYSMGPDKPMAEQRNPDVNCGCQKFRLSRRRT